MTTGSTACGIPKCGKIAVVKRWILGVGIFPILEIYLCSTCKDIQIWNDDVVKEEKIIQKENQNVVQ